MGLSMRSSAGRLDEDPVPLVERFHGHLGPYVVLGYRMGRLARRELGEDPFELTAEVMAGPETPLSCLVDGVQLGSGCTLGKGNISVRDERRAEASFHHRDGRRLMVGLSPRVTEELAEGFEEEASMVQYAEGLMDRPDDEIFVVLG